MAEIKVQYDYAKLFEEESKKLTELEKLKTDLNSVLERIDNSLPDTAPTLSGLDASISTLRKVLSDQKAAKDKALDHNVKVAVNNGKVELAKETLNKLKTDLAEVSLLLETAKERNTILNVLNDAFSTKGIITYKIESMVKVFESLINQYLQVLSDGRFTLEFIVEDAKLALKLYDDSTEIEIAQLSSGEFNRVNTATLLAVRRMMAAVSKVNLNVLFLDEVVSVLDKSGKDTLIEVLLKEQGLNSLVVSHGYTHPLAGKIMVVKENNISRLSYDK
jgi:DNA repair exonuclease SbcCD ATPase subunit